MRWVGIDEAGYGPNLGPLVMTAVVAEGPIDRPPDLWADLTKTIGRAGSPDDRLWVDDSKLVYRAGKGLDRLELATLAALDSAGYPPPDSIRELFEILGVTTLADAELDLWCTGEVAIPSAISVEALARVLDRRPFSGADWSIRSIRTVVIGPDRFNRELDRLGLKSAVHFGAFERLLRPIWEAKGETFVRGDKHGGRHFYAGPLGSAFPDARIDRGEEGPDRSCYRLDGIDRRLDLELRPRADSVDGLVALASMVSKLVREHWMGVFNDYWMSIIPGLRPTAGYPVDAARFRLAIEPECVARGLDPRVWWRRK